MTILRVVYSQSEEFYRIDADSDDVQEVVDDLEERYCAETPEDEQDLDAKVDYVINGLEERGFDPWYVSDIITLHADW